MTLPLAILLLAIPPGPGPPDDPPFSGVVDSAGGLDPYWETPCISVIGGNTIRHAWPPRRVTVRLADVPGTWTADVLLVGDRVVVSGPSYYWSDCPTLTVAATRDFGLPLILATERSVVRFAAADHFVSARKMVDNSPGIPASLREAVVSLGSRRFAARERATAVLATSGRAGVRAAAWAEESDDAEVRHRAGLAIGRAMRGEGER